MKAMVIYEPGSWNQFVQEERDIPDVKEGWSLVKVKGFGINHSEIFTRQGLSPSVQFPRVLGIECVGVLEKSTDPTLKEGTTVLSIMGEMGRAFDGSYQEYVLLPNHQIYPIETKLDWKDLAAIPETYYTAFGSLLNLRIQNGQSVLVRAATSGVGIAFVKLVKGMYPDCKVTGSCRSMGKAGALKKVGFDEVILDKDGVLQTGEAFDRALELIGPATLKDTCGHIQENGIVCSTGQLGGQWTMEGFDPIMDLPANGYLTSFYSGNVSKETLNEMIKNLEEHHVDVAPEKVFALEEVGMAHAYLEGHKSFGKCVVVIE